MRGGPKATVLAGVFVACFVAATTLIRSASPRAPATSSVETGPGEEVAVVLAVSTDCGWSRHPLFFKALTQLRHKLLADIDSSTRVRFIGIASSPDPGTGQALLTRFGSFDETVVGARPNVGVLRYLMNDFRGPVSYPQVVIVRRVFAYRPDGSLFMKDEEVVRRIIGFDQLTAIAAREAK